MSIAIFLQQSCTSFSFLKSLTKWRMNRQAFVTMGEIFIQTINPCILYLHTSTLNEFVLPLETFWVPSLLLLGIFFPVAHDQVLFFFIRYIHYLHFK